MRRALRGRGNSNWVLACQLSDAEIRRAIAHGVADEALLVSLTRQLPFRKWQARDHCGRCLVVADEHLVREWRGELPS